jgi:hypothetical protein
MLNIFRRILTNRWIRRASHSSPQYRPSSWFLIHSLSHGYYPPHHPPLKYFSDYSNYFAFTSLNKVHLKFTWLLSHIQIQYLPHSQEPPTALPALSPCSNLSYTLVSNNFLFKNKHKIHFSDYFLGYAIHFFFQSMVFTAYQRKYKLLMVNIKSSTTLLVSTSSSSAPALIQSPIIWPNSVNHCASMVSHLCFGTCEDLCKESLSPPVMPHFVTQNTVLKRTFNYNHYAENFRDPSISSFH